MAKPQGFCIFCGGPGLTKQHVWSDMLKTIIPRQNSWKHVRNKYTYHSRGISNIPTEDTLQGDRLTKKFRKVCKGCNSGWISEIEGRLKPLLAGLIAGSKLTISSKQRADLAMWITIATVMAEYTDPNSKVIPEQDCQYMYQYRQPPTEWLIRFGHYLGSEYLPSVYRHSYGRVSDPPFDEKSSSGPANFQISLHSFGEVIFQVGSSYTDGASIRERFKLGQFGEIGLWPDDGKSIEWPPKSAIGDAAANAMLGRELYFAQDERLFRILL